MRRRVKYSFFLFVAAAIVLPFHIFSQSSENLFQKYGYEGLRNIGVDRLTDIDLLCDSSYIYQSRDSTTNEWILQEKAVYRYDKQGREVSRNIFTYRDHQWHKQLKIINTYKSDVLSIRDELVWDSITNDWVPSAMHTFSYNFLDKVDEMKTYYYINSKWVPGDKIIYFYNTDFLLDFESHALWNPELNDWTPAKRTLYVYNDEEEVSKEVVQSWIDDTAEWINKTSQSFIFNEEKVLVSATFSIWDVVEEVWINNSSIYIDYGLLGNNSGKINGEELIPVDYAGVSIENHEDDDARSVNEIVKSYWDETVGTWEMHQKQTNYWTKHLKGNLQTSQKEIVCKFANPYMLGLPWYCDSLNPNILYTLKVYDLLGRCFYTDTFYGTSSFRIDQNLETGFYIFEISGGLDKHSEKVYVKNK